MRIIDENEGREKKRNKKRIVSSIAIDPFRFFSNHDEQGVRSKRERYKERKRERKDCSSLRVHRFHRFLDPSSFFFPCRRGRKTLIEAFGLFSQESNTIPLSTWKRIRYSRFSDW